VQAAEPTRSIRPQALSDVRRLSKAMTDEAACGGLGARPIDLHGTRPAVLPPGTIEDIVHGAISLVTEGFYELVRNGAIAVHHDTAVVRLLEKDRRPYAELEDGSVLPPGPHRLRHRIHPRRAVSGR
jgi:hypothetical protein